MIYLGKIVKTRSNRGEVVFQPDPQSNYSALTTGDKVILKSPKYQKPFEIEYVTEKNGAVVIKFIGINTIIEAYKLIGYSMYTSVKKAKTKTEPTIIGFKVFDRDGSLWGKVQRVEVASDNPLIVIETGEKTILVPYNAEILINPPEGLKGLNNP